MSWHGPSAPRVEGMATKSAVVASCASKEASTASRIFCWVSAFMLVCCPLVRCALRNKSKHIRQDLVETGPPFRITEVPIQFVAPVAAETPDGGQQERAVPDHRRVAGCSRCARLQSLPGEETARRPADQRRAGRPQDTE